MLTLQPVPESSDGMSRPYPVMIEPVLASNTLPSRDLPGNSVLSTMIRIARSNRTTLTSDPSGSFTGKRSAGSSRRKDCGSDEADSPLLGMGMVRRGGSHTGNKVQGRGDGMVLAKGVISQGSGFKSVFLLPDSSHSATIPWISFLVGIGIVVSFFVRRSAIPMRFRYG